MKTLFLFLALVFAVAANAQIKVTSTAVPGYVTLYAQFTDTDAYVNPGVMADDQYSDTIGLGFNFNFYGSNYSSCVIGDNGNICFELSKAKSYDQWQITGPLLGDTSMRNTICAPWGDLDPGDHFISTKGVAPNREFVVFNCEAWVYFCYWMLASSVVVLHETTNLVDVYIGHHSYCPGWNGGYGIVGIQNATGTAATVAPGRDYPVTWDGKYEAYRFTPVLGGVSYTVDTIPYDSVPYPASLTSFCWYETISGTSWGCGNSVTLNPTEPALEYTVYAIACGDTFTHLSFWVDTNGIVNEVPLVMDNSKYVVYPNPASNTITISGTAPLNSVVITNLTGEVIFRSYEVTRRMAVNVAMLPAGMYFVQMNGTEVERFMKR